MIVAIARWATNYPPAHAHTGEGGGRETEGPERGARDRERALEKEGAEGAGECARARDTGGVKAPNRLAISWFWCLMTLRRPVSLVNSPLGLVTATPIRVVCVHLQVCAEAALLCRGDTVHCKHGGVVGGP
jgi:hypothetical protein